ncbi:MAG: hypothetical protein KME21_00650 [Desmonostoc vinosum HA7617-LM4]|jgi:hypothetical protein|nr:hypothetical protein [Desmonostoc vinosum HA7617-LM4]
MIDVKTAVNAAYEYIKSLQDIMGYSLPDLRLEEVELSEDKGLWLITLGFDREKVTRNLFNSSRQIERVYKLFRINSETGEVEAMKIRQV